VLPPPRPCNLHPKCVGCRQALVVINRRSSIFYKFFMYFIQYLSDRRSFKRSKSLLVFERYPFFIKLFARCILFVCLSRSKECSLRNAILILLAEALITFSVDRVAFSCFWFIKNILKTIFRSSRQERLLFFLNRDKRSSEFAPLSYFRTIKGKQSARFPLPKTPDKSCEVGGRVTRMDRFAVFS